MSAYTHCRTCSEPIVWLLTDKGRKMPVNAETAHRNDTHYDSDRHRSHFATCPDMRRHKAKAGP